MSLIHTADAGRASGEVRGLLDRLETRLGAVAKGGDPVALGLLADLRRAMAALPWEAGSEGASAEAAARLRAEAALRESEARLKIAQEAAAFGFFDHPVGPPGNGEADRWSEETFRLVGRDPSEGAPGLDEFVATCVHPDDRGFTGATLARAASAGAGFDFTFRVVTPDGTVRHVQGIGDPVPGPGGGIVRLAGTLLDISGRRRLERAQRQTLGELEAIFRAYPDVHFRLSEDGRILDYIAGREVDLDFLPGDVLERRLEDVVPAESSREVAEVFGRVRETSQMGTMEFVLPRPGNPRRYEARILPLGDAGYIALVRDISERAALERALADLAVEEQQWIGRELHDGLGQQVAGIAMLVGSLQQRLCALAPEGAEARAAADLKAFVGEAQEMIGAIVRGVRPVGVDANGLMEALADLAASVSKRYGVACSFSCPHPVLVGDGRTATQLYYIAQEAVKNAVRHAGGGAVSVVLADGPDALTLEVNDRGKGIDPGAPPSGSGMGVRIMRHRAGLVGGRIELGAGPEGKGTGVRCTVPRRARGGGGG